MLNRTTERVILGSLGLGAAGLGLRVGSVSGEANGRISELSKIRKQNEKENKEIARKAYELGLKNSSMHKVAASPKSSGEAGSSTSVSSGPSAASPKTPTPSPTAPITKSMVNADIQPVSRSDNRVPDTTLPGHKVTMDNNIRSTHMSNLEDRRILNHDIRSGYNG